MQAILPVRSIDSVDESNAVIRRIHATEVYEQEEAG